MRRIRELTPPSLIGVIRSYANHTVLIDWGLQGIVGKHVAVSLESKVNASRMSAGTTVTRSNLTGPAWVERRPWGN